MRQLIYSNLCQGALCTKVNSEPIWNRQIRSIFTYIKNIIYMIRYAVPKIFNTPAIVQWLISIRWKDMMFKSGFISFYFCNDFFKYIFDRIKFIYMALFWSIHSSVFKGSSKREIWQI